MNDLEIYIKITTDKKINLHKNANKIRYSDTRPKLTLVPN